MTTPPPENPDPNEQWGQPGQPPNAGGQPGSGGQPYSTGGQPYGTGGQPYGTGGQPYGTPPPGYGYQPQPYGYAAPVDHPQGTTILILGILSLVICGLLGPFAWVMGNKALAEINANPTAYSNRGTVVAGRICGMIASIILILLIGLVVILVVAAVASSS